MTNMATIPIEVKPTFFSISGFLLPGVVFIGSVGTLVALRYRELLTRWFDHASGKPVAEIGLLPAAMLLLVTLAVAFVVGSILSELFSVLRTVVIRRMFRDKRKTYLKSVLNAKSLKELIHQRATPLEAYVYMQTCGLDLHWYAGRVRMVGGSGLAWIFTSLVGRFLGTPAIVNCGFLVMGLIALFVAAFRSYRFDKYVVSTAGVLLKGGGSLKLSTPPTD